MKKYLVIGLIVLVGGALLIVPLLKDEPELPSDDKAPTPQSIELPAQFSFLQNLAVKCDLSQTIEVQVKQKDIALLEVSFDGNVIQKWENPTSNVSFPFTATTVGTYSFTLISTLKNGNRLKDERSVRVVSDIVAEQLTATVVDPYPHNEKSFTQGLEFANGKLYEGTGLYGESEVLEVNLETGERIDGVRLGGNYFGEGITILNDKLYQITWREGTCFVYDLATLQILTEDKSYIGEGWGLCNDGTDLIMSDGTETIYFRDPDTFQEKRRINVYNEEGPIYQLNELEFIDGKIYANVYQSNLMVGIDPETGKVLEMINCDALAQKGKGSGLELNGIAQNDVDGKIYMTGKNWPLLFEVTFTADPIP